MPSMMTAGGTGSSAGGGGSFSSGGGGSSFSASGMATGMASGIGSMVQGIAGAQAAGNDASALRKRADLLVNRTNPELARRYHHNMVNMGLENEASLGNAFAKMAGSGVDVGGESSLAVADQHMTTLGRNMNEKLTERNFEIRSNQITAESMRSEATQMEKAAKGAMVGAIVGAVGSAVGGAFGGPAGAALGGALGSAVGGMVG